MSSAISRCNENIQLKRELMVKNDRAMQDIDYQVVMQSKPTSREPRVPRASLDTDLGASSSLSVAFYYTLEFDGTSIIQLLF